MSVRPSKAEVLQLDGGGVLLVWRPVQSDDPVTYCVQYCSDVLTDGEFQFQMKIYISPSIKQNISKSLYICFFILSIL